MQTTKDILKSAPELKKLPYSIPDGYFDRMKTDMVSFVTGHEERHLPLFQRLAPFAAVAATFLFLETAGTIILEKTTPATDQAELDEFYFYSNMIPVTDPYAVETIQEGQFDEIQEDDIIEYLIYSGVTAEVIELSR